MSSELRHEDYSLSREQSEFRSMLRDLLGRHSSSAVVRSAEPAGFSAELWDSLRLAGLVDFAIPKARGGQDAGLVEFALASVELGRALAPVPLVDHLVAARLLARIWDDQRAISVPWESILAGRWIGTVAPISRWDLPAELVPSGAVANGVIALHDDSLVLLTRNDETKPASNYGSAPLAWWGPDQDGVSVQKLVSGYKAKEFWTQARTEWRIVAAAALVGLLEGAASLARDFSLEREAFGSQIAQFQAISHALVDMHVDASTGWRTVMKAAWFAEYEPNRRPELAAIALVHSTRAAQRGTASAVHVHGGHGVTLEADVTLYYRRAAAWALVAGGVGCAIDEVGAVAAQRGVELANAASSDRAETGGGEPIDGLQQS